MSLPDGIYDRLIDSKLLAELKELIEAGHVTLAQVLDGERATRLSGAIAKLIEDELDDIRVDNEGSTREQTQLAVISALLGTLRRDASQGSIPQQDWSAPLQTLRSVHRHSAPYPFPPTGVLRPWLFTAGRSDPSLLSDLRAELASANNVDILVSFIKWSGLRKLWDVFESCAVTDASGKPKTNIRILTTTYMGATEARAVLALARLPGVNVRVSYDTRRTRLHAKAWMFHRATGFGSAFVGSANLSAAALIGGLEWTLKITEATQADLFVAAKAQFETLWNDPEFELVEPNSEEGVRRLSAALSREQIGSDGAQVTWFDLHPRPFQEEMLDRLTLEREHGRRRNLVVAATGTGKTVVAALDYRRTCQIIGGQPRLLFVAHRVEILRQAMGTYRQALRDPAFGEILAEGRQPNSFDHLFATIQSVTSNTLISRFGPTYWNTVVIDECHHLPAASFEQFVKAIKPDLLLGLTATPLRADGKLINAYFDNRPDGRAAVELRLWDALDQQLLSPFEYYGTNDETDFSSVSWDGAASELAALDSVISGNTVRANLVYQSIQKYAADTEAIKAVAFCVSVRHAEFMAEHFSRKGISAEAVTGQTDREIRERIPSRLATGELKIVCTCDLYNEGVDLPSVNTLLLLRPTQSPVLFEQQLGRGLRLAADKESCLVLDFVGRHRQEFRFDHLLQVMTGLPKGRLEEEIENGFPTLPPGCHISFDRVARERVLASLKFIANQTWPRLSRELQGYAALQGVENVTLASFLNDQALDLEDIYRANARAGWTALQRAAGIINTETGPDEVYLSRRFSSLLHSNDPQYLQLWIDIADRSKGIISDASKLQQRRIQMLAYQLFATHEHRMNGAEFLRRLGASPELREELGELATILASRSGISPRPLLSGQDDWPLNLHARYEIREILTAVGWLSPERRQPFQSGTLALGTEKVELLFVTLDKSEGYHSRIAYHDYAISPELFHWQTQNSAGLDTPAGRRYAESHENGWRFLLFVRETREDAYCAIGQVSQISIEGDRPMSIVWRLTDPLPAELFRAFSVLRA